MEPESNDVSNVCVCCCCREVVKESFLEYYEIYQLHVENGMALHGKPIYVSLCVVHGVCLCVYMCTYYYGTLYLCIHIYLLLWHFISVYIYILHVYIYLLWHFIYITISLCTGSSVWVSQRYI